MSGFTGDLRDLLSPAVEAARAALDDLAADEVPQGLRRVAAYSGGRLPPPLARSVLEALDGDGWLRDKALEKMPEGGSASPAGAFLRRDEGWWLIVADALADQRGRTAAGASARSKARVDELTAKLDVAKKRLKAAGAELDAERVRARRLADKRSSPPKRSAGDKRSAARVKELQAALAAAVDDRVEAEAMIARLRNRVKSVLRDQRQQQSAAGSPTEFGTDPVAMARNLDLMAAAAPHRHADAPAEAGDVTAAKAPIGLPPGIRPDTQEAIEWLASLDEDAMVIVDGYNVLYGLDPATFTTSSSRGFLADQLARLRRRNPRVRVAVVYDSSLPGGREPHALPGGVELHFSLDDEIADDKIVELADAAPGPVVVITSDRELRLRAERVGALALWSEALVEWMTPG